MKNFCNSSGAFKLSVFVLIGLSSVFWFCEGKTFEEDVTLNQAEKEMFDKVSI
jgi:hypothetical protein